MAANAFRAATISILLAAVHAGAQAATFGTPSLVGESNYTHFWMPQPLFSAAAIEGAPLFVGIALHGDSGPWGACPNPKHPQNCTAMYRGGADGKGWGPAEPLEGNALIRLDGLSSRGFAYKMAVDTATNTSGTVSWGAWRYAPATRAVTGVTHGVARVTGLPPVMGASLIFMPSSTQLANGDWVTIAYGGTQAEHAAGAGNRTCTGVYHWQAHWCSTDFVLGTSECVAPPACILHRIVCTVSSPWFF